jgi:hypothetical protein
MKNVEKVAEDLHNIIRDENFESFIAEQFLSLKSSTENEPLISISYKSASLDIWKNDINADFILIKSSVGSKKKADNFKKNINKEQVINEISKFVNDVL